MHTTLPHLVFATNFSETCHAAIPIVAQLLDRLRTTLTLVQVQVQARGQRGQAPKSLPPLFAVASRDPGCERARYGGPTAAGIAAYCRENPDAVLIVPPSEHTGRPRPAQVLLRAQVLQRVATPTPTPTSAYANAPPREASRGGHVACWITGRESGLELARDAADLARRSGAELHLLHVMPEVSEGLLMHSLFNEEPLAEPAVMRWLTDIAAGLQDEDLRVRIHLGTGNPRKRIAGLLKRARADVLVVEHDAVPHRKQGQTSLDAALAETPCLLMCVPRRPALRG